MDDANEQPSGTIVVGFNEQGQLFSSADMNNLTPRLACAMLHAVQVMQGRLIVELGKNLGIEFNADEQKCERDCDDGMPRPATIG